MAVKGCNNFSVVLLVMIFITGSYSASADEDGREYLPTRYGISMTGGNSFHPESDISYYLMSGFVMFDYDRVWKHRAPDPLRFKVEGSVGAARYKKTRLVTSVNIFAVYYLDFIKGPNVKPFLEGGIGIIYSDFQIRGQGLRINFNPQLGVGAEFKAGKDDIFFFSLRLHHISNGGLDNENTGIDSVMGVLGYYF